MWISTVLITAGVALGSWVAVFPGVLEKLFGLGYDFYGTWGVHRGTFEALTLGTLAVIVLVAVVGYATGREVRESAAVDVPIADELSSDIATVT